MNEMERNKAEAERQEAESERVENEEIRQTQEGAGIEGESEISRVDAEVERDHAEEARAKAALSRREAEKGRVEAEEVREEAEGIRATAETERSRIRYFWLKLAAVIATPIAFIALTPSIIGIYLVEKESNKLDDEISVRCEDARLNRLAIRDTILLSFSTLGYRYNEETKQAIEVGGQLAYYNEHPEERSAALKRALATVERFPEIEC